MNNKGQLTITALLISLVVFLLFMGVGFSVFDEFFQGDPYNSGINTSFYGSLDVNDRNQELKGTVFELSDGLVATNQSLSDQQDKEGDLSLRSFTTLLNLKQTYTLIDGLSQDLNEQLSIPPIFLSALLVIVVIIVTIALVASIRGLGRL